MDAVEDGREPALLVVAGDHFLGFGQRVARALVGEDAVVRGGLREEGVVLVSGRRGFVRWRYQRKYECVSLVDIYKGHGTRGEGRDR